MYAAQTMMENIKWEITKSTLPSTGHKCQALTA